MFLKHGKSSRHMVLRTAPLLVLVHFGDRGRIYHLAILATLVSQKSLDRIGLDFC